LRQQKREQAEQMAAQSLKTVYLKIAAMIHPDREQDEAKKEEKTELFQQASQAYEQQDLFYLLKLQLQLEQNKGVGAKELSAEQVKFYKLALDAQSQQLESQIEEILDSFQLAKKVKAEHLHISDVYKAIDADCAELKQQLKWEKERLKHMKKVSGVEMLLGHGVL
jgi:curved DNA-binding protein CbpA